MPLIPSVLRRENSITVGLLVAVGTYLIYTHQLPQNADVRGVQPHNDDIEATRKQAAWESLGLLGVVTLLSRDLNVFIIGGLALVGIDATYKHANAFNPNTGRVDQNMDYIETSAAIYPMDNYSSADAS